MAITEADIENYSGMYLRKDEAFLSQTCSADLSPHEDRAGNIDASYAVETATPFQSPWRVLMIADEPGKADRVEHRVESESAVEDCGYFVDQGGQVGVGLVERRGRAERELQDGHEYGDDEALHRLRVGIGIPLHADRCGLGGRKDPTASAAEPRLADITHTSPEIDMPELLRYAKEKNVKIWLWAHWTSVDKYMDQAFPLFEKWGIAGVKIDFMNRDDQWMVDWYRRVVAKAAAHHLMIDYHGAFKPDGLRRTYPNLMTREGVMGKEYLKVSARVTPAHNATLPFTRMLAGPMDYTPGAFGNSEPEELCGAALYADGAGNPGTGTGALRGLREPAGNGVGLSGALQGAEGV